VYLTAFIVDQSPLQAGPWWLAGGNAQTIWPALYAQRFEGPTPAYRRERWSTPDEDFIDVDWLVEDKTLPEDRPLLVLFHGLEGSSLSHYAQAFAWVARESGWDFAVPHFRGCSGELNWRPRAYHSGDHEEVHWILQRFRELAGTRRVMAVGVSLGGNALMRWAGEWGQLAKATVDAIASVSAPLDLAAAGAAIDTGFNRWVYAKMFLRTMVRKAQDKWQQFPGLFDLAKATQASTLFEFDDVFTGPLHGFKGTVDYWHQASAKALLHDVRVPALVLNATNDPFVPGGSLPTRQEVSRSVTLWQPRHGGHVGFAAPMPGGLGLPGQVWGMPQAVARWLAGAAGATHG
jgi:predicted alpha/beta-fold hydrolase